MRHTQKERIMRSVCARGRRSFSFARSLSASDIESMMNGEKKSAQILNLSRASFALFEREHECLVAPDHDAPSRVLNRLGFAAFVLDFPDVCRKKEKRRHGGGAKARVSECRFLRERETRSSIPVVVFLALLSSLSFFQKSDFDETAFQIPPRDARAREKERVERERETTQ